MTGAAGEEAAEDHHQNSGVGRWHVWLQPKRALDTAVVMAALAKGTQNVYEGGEGDGNPVLIAGSGFQRLQTLFTRGRRVLQKWEGSEGRSVRGCSAGVGIIIVICDG